MYVLYSQVINLYTGGLSQLLLMLSKLTTIFFFSRHCVSQVCLSHDGIKSSEAESQTEAAKSRRESVIHKESADIAQLDTIPNADPNIICTIYGRYRVIMPRTKRQCMKCHWLLCFGGFGSAFFVVWFRVLVFCNWRFVPRLKVAWGNMPGLFSISGSLKFESFTNKSMTFFSRML